jgi:hypothetical protein
MRIEPPEFFSVVLSVGLVLTLVYEAYNRFLPRSAWFVAKLVDTPILVLQPVVEFLRRPSILSSSRFAYSLSIRGCKSDPVYAPASVD